MDMRKNQPPWLRALQALKVDPCQPPRWAGGGHLQTILGSYLPIPRKFPKREEVRVPVSDGDALLAMHYAGQDTGVLLYLFHGLSGSDQSTYMCLSLTMALTQGFDVLAVNHRGCGAGAGLALQPYHSGRADDMAEVIRYGKKRFPHHKHVAVGFSLSGNALLLLAAGERGWEPLDFAVAVNAPIQLEKAAIALKQGMSKLYDWRFSRRCRQAVQQRLDAGLQGNYHIPKWCSLHDFDNHYTAPAGGFENREDYYYQCSAARFVDRIAFPTVVITSNNDPLVDVSDYHVAPFSENVFLHLEPEGGHIGYLDKHKGRWLPYFLQKVITTALANLP